MASPYLFTPAVFLAGDSYQIVVRLKQTGLLYVQVGQEIFADHTNGVVRSFGLTRKVTVPQALLDREKQYTLRFVPLAQRTPYSPALGENSVKTFAFQPVLPVTQERSMRIYMLSDTHSHVAGPVMAAGYFGQRPDLLLLCGDIADKAQDYEHIDRLYEIIEKVTQGESPVVFVRGNHDTRGEMAECLPNMIGTVNGSTYFTFHAGSLRGVALDCGEDKLDTHKEYGGAYGVAFYHGYRQEQTHFLDRLLEEKEKWKEVYSIAFCHVPFTQTLGERGGIFDNERENHADWTQRLNALGVQALLSGHTHRAYFNFPGGENDAYGQNFVTVVGSQPSFGQEEESYIGTAIELGWEGITFSFTDEKGTCLKTLRLSGDGHVVK